MSRKKVRDSIDIKDKLDGPIGDVIAALKELQKSYPDGEVDVTTNVEYGDYFASARLNFSRTQTPLEKELEAWEVRAELHRNMQTDAAAFERSGVPYPRAAEMETLRKELGFFAMAPMRGSLTIYNGEVLVQDMRGARRRDGTFIIKMLGFGGPDIDSLYERIDEQYAS